jgi:hypothetical protein
LFNRSILNLHEEIYKMTFTIKKIAVAVALSAAAMSAQAVDFSSMTVTGGTFEMGLGGPFIPANITPGLDLLAGNNQQINTSAGPLFIFGIFGPVNAFISDGAYMPFGGSNVAGGSATAPTASGDFGGSITVDLSAWTANWNGNNFGQGGIATGTVDAAGNYSIAWSSTVVGGSFDGQTGNWTMTGQVAAVPEASTYGMMLAGLGLVGGMVARRRKLVA